ncbi:MAG: TauD/TfdA family dioxygenase [Solirubrobacteraceae bacterium]
MNHDSSQGPLPSAGPLPRRLRTRCCKAPQTIPICVDFASTDALDAGAEAALDALAQALAQVRRTSVLQPRHIAIVDNRIALHRRTAFRPRYDGRDRWLQRTYVQLDSCKSRPVRQFDGNVMS